MIDTHCHLTFPEYKGRLNEVLANAAAEGVAGAITISTTTSDCLQALEVARLYPNVWCTAGVHPLYSDRRPHVWENMRLVASDPKCVAWGELGLDNHYDRPPREMQHAVLEEQLQFILACSRGGEEGGGRAINLPVVIHCRDAFADLIPVLRASGLPADRFVFHCFTGTPDDMRLLLDFGAWVSFTGVLTYKNAPLVRDAARLAALDRIMVETDAPFLTPEPHRKVKVNEPKYAAVVARALAEVHGMAWDEFHAALNENTRRFFGIAARCAPNEK